jgi:hypothetical protein
MYEKAHYNDRYPDLKARRSNIDLMRGTQKHADS